MSMTVINGGVLSLLQDSGRRGWLRLGLTHGGPVDPEAFGYSNRLLDNHDNAAAIEITAGGLCLQAALDTMVCLAGAPMPLTIDGRECDGWTAHPVCAGDIIEVGFARRGCRAYLAVAGGFVVEPAFGSVATVVREGIGGLNGQPLKAGDTLPCDTARSRRPLSLPLQQRPQYPAQATVRVIPTCTQGHFSRLEKRRFFGAPYRVSQDSDRMGYRLTGPAVTSEVDGILSEGTCHGSVQIPPDGQPIVLLNDRQTMGGYPKIGTALAIDTARLAQLPPGGTVHFAAVTPATARKATQLAARFALSKSLRST